eukprot:343033-Ditylum_brightwellii.AAC.1
MTIVEKENVKTSPNCVTRDITFGEMLPGKTKEFCVTIMVCVTMTWRSATLCEPAESTFGPCTVSQSSRGSDRFGLSRTSKGRPKAQPKRQR